MLKLLNYFIERNKYNIILYYLNINSKFLSLSLAILLKAFKLSKILYLKIMQMHFCWLSY